MTAGESSETPPQNALAISVGRHHSFRASNAREEKVSVVIPCYNESESLPDIVKALLSAFDGRMALEIVIVDDSSTDGSFDVANGIAKDNPSVKVLRHESNMGKGAALKTGFAAATGDFVCVQDADLEYDPRDYLDMLGHMERTGADVVFGSRYLVRESRRAFRWWHTTMNKALTLLSNVFSDMGLTDMETCYKLFRAEIIREIAPRLREKRFGFEPECVAYVAKGMHRRGWKVQECAISYRPRTFAEGKKIGWIDGIRALWCIVKYNLLVR